MPDCINTGLVPLYRVVSAAIVDVFEDQGRVQQTFQFWAARKLKELNRQVLKTGKKTVLLTVNRSTNTATLPPDFAEEFFVGVMVNGKKIRLKLRPELVDEKNVEDIPCEDKCKACNQDKAICTDLTVTEETVLVIINDTVQEQTVIKKLYPDGSYYLETRIPVWDIESETIIYTTTKQFIAALDLKPCGCIDDTPENIETIRCCNYDVYCQHYAPCDNNCSPQEYGGYKIFPETGLIQFDKIGKFTKVYMEYWGFMPKKNGQYMVPEVAFETLVEWIKFRNVDGKRSSPNVDKAWRWKMYDVARRNMEKEIGRIGLGQIIQAVSSIPKFDLDSYVCEPVAVAAATPVTSSTVDDCTSTTTATCPPASGTKVFTPFSIAQVAGVGSGPVAGTNSYQDSKLIGALGVNVIIVNNMPETIQAGQFSLDTVTGTILRFQGDGVTANNWFAGDILIVPTFFKLV